jgi:hypothetical protein
VEANFRSLADRWWENLGANLNLDRHGLGDRVDHVFFGLQDVADRVLETVFGFMGHKTQQRRRHGTTNWLKGAAFSTRLGSVTSPAQWGGMTVPIMNL